VFNDRLVKAAFATTDMLQVNAGFEEANRIVVYEISTVGARECDAMTYHAVQLNVVRVPGTLGRNGKSGSGGGGGCGGGKKNEESINEKEIVGKVASLTGVSVLFVNKTLNAYSVLALNEARIFTVKVDDQREIADVIVRLQEMLRGDPPLWLQHCRSAMPHGSPESAQ